MDNAPLTDRLMLVPKTVAEARSMVASMSLADRAQVSADWLAHVYSEGEVSPWFLGYSIRLRDSGEVIGHCGFKGPPNTAGVVELAYGLAPAFEGKGYATEAARAAVASAFTAADVRVVCAHTLTSANASAHVLTKCGFRHSGEVMDPDDGLVQRWEIERDP
ncbi:MAG: GNAT family N-acetyltransferase [Opitutus sp.]